IRPCGPDAGRTPLADCSPDAAPPLTAGLVGDPVELELRWPASATGYALEKSESLSAPAWQAVAEPPAVEGDSQVLRLSPSGPTYYRLVSQ
ncbi:MAG: hypothetical protein KIS63_24205, partial [Caldilineales bacterium]|nr:hypothetical protein [Caldilineales bacterium]